MAGQVRDHQFILDSGLCVCTYQGVCVSVSESVEYAPNTTDTRKQISPHH